MNEMNQKPKNKISFIASDWNMFAVETSDYDSHAIALFKKCIGRVYDQANRRWLFPNKSYKYLVELVQDCEDLEIVSYIDAAELAKIQIIIYKEDGQYFYVQTPYDDALVGLFNKIGGGFFYYEAKLWCFEHSSRECFEETMKEKMYQIMYEKDRPKSI